MSGREQLAALGYPCTEAVASSAVVVSWPVCPDRLLSQDLVDTSGLSEGQLRKMSGNGMSLPCGGFVLLMTLLCVEPKVQE